MNILDKVNKTKLTGLIIFILIMVLIVCSGCVGGKSVNANGTGTTITAPRLVQQPNGIFKLEPVKITPPKSKPVKMEPVKSLPVSPESTSAKPTLIKPKMNVIPAREIPKDPPKIIIPQLPIITDQTGELPIIIDNSGNEYNLTPTGKDPKIGINWMELIEFYLWAVLFIAVMYFAFKTARRKTENMIKKERSKKTSRKSPKKKVTRKRK